ncbi:hypothetical protein L1887_09066 [Cichorium endivia]|nr:hypothetical protein L1887_09066 [Cichorium endivia]
MLLLTKKLNPKVEIERLLGTLRLPKQGKMLLSVHGSPLGVYKENNMDTIHGKHIFKGNRRTMSGFL